ncbi:cytochrome c biogenesis CcdA family protein [Gleimia hominis]|uniref:cytochrome c biogenesis CcdA family protein n=1 Tax=Gleimia hominis TaxID=595468 RepID=UPI000C80B8E7|nr:cytochrome c biogenesis protein CcdA [Gleimia hominis]WIK63790.1 cytochrome c biogenesis protein CcdA [Gleimia hominis]
MTSPVTLPIALLAGLLAFASPCFLPVVPVFAAYVAGTEQQRTRTALKQAVVFTLAFSAVFIGFWLIVGAAGSLIAQYKDLIRILAGILVVIMGTIIGGFIRIPALSQTRRATVNLDPDEAPTLRRSTLLGLAFGAGWTPCISPVLGSIIMLASSSESMWKGTLLMVVFCLGLGIPFILVATGVGWMSDQLAFMRRHQRGIQLTSAVLLIVTGILIILDFFTKLSAFIPTLG